MDVGAGEHRGHVPPPTFQRFGQSDPFHVTWFALLKNFEDIKINRKIHVSGDFKRSKFQNLAGEHAPGPLADLRQGFSLYINPLPSCKMFCQFIKCPPYKVLNFTSKNPAKVPLNLCAPTYILLPTSLGGILR